MCSTQVLFPSRFLLNLTGSTTLSISGVDHRLTWSTTAASLTRYTVSGSNLGGSYIYNNPSSEVTATFQGGAGGVLTGFPDILYVALTGPLEVTFADNGVSLGVSSTLELSLLFQVTVTSTSVLVTLLRGYGSVLVPIGGTPYPLQLNLNSNITLVQGANSVLVSGGIRVVTIGDFTLNLSL